MASLSESQVIEILSTAVRRRSDVLIGIGDDGAVLAVPAEAQLVSVLDTLNEDVHFPAGMEARAIGHRALAVNLSDLAAMGARPAWASLSLSLPDPDARWLEEFADGFHALAGRWDVALVGGDTVRGPLSVAVHLSGFVSPGAAITRHGAQEGDLVYVTGMPGEAMGGLQILLSGRGDASPQLVKRFTWPEPRVAEGQSLVGVASSMIDISDGLATDLERLAQASGVRISVALDDLPVSPELKEVFGRERALELAVAGGDDYELLVTVPPGMSTELAEKTSAWACRLTCIGRVESGSGTQFTSNGNVVAVDRSRSWRHFAGGNE